MTSTSKIAKASFNSPSLRTTIPFEIAKSLDIVAGDVITWHVEERRGSKIGLIKKVDQSI